MHVVFRYKGFRFFFYCNEGSPRELEQVFEENLDLIKEAWNGYFPAQRHFR